MKEKINIGIIGVGQRGFAYVELCKRSNLVNLTALCDSNPERLHDFAERLGCSDRALYSDVETMLKESDIDAVIITVPDFHHAEVAIKALTFNKHIMLEKPMAPTVAECHDILAACPPDGPIIQLGFVLRAHPVYRKVKELVSGGRLGKIMSISTDESLGVMHGASYMRRWHRKTKNSGGFMLAKCSHDIDLLSWIADSAPCSVASFGSCSFFTPDKQTAPYCSECPDKDCRFRFHGEMVQMSTAEKAKPSEKGFDLCVYTPDKDIVDNQVVILEYFNGVNATFSLNLFAPVANRTMKVIGSEAYLEADTHSKRIVLRSSLDQSEEIFDCRSGNESGHGGSDQLFFDEFVNCIRNGTRPQADYQAGLDTTIIGNAIQEAYTTKRVIHPEYKSVKR